MKGQATALAVTRTIEHIRILGEQWKYPELFDEDGQTIPDTKQ